MGLVDGDERAFPPALTIPSKQDLATGRVIHFFFAWIFFATLAVWLAAALASGHLRRDLLPRGVDIRGLAADVKSHLRLKFNHGASYAPLQKLAYFGVLFIAFPMMIATGLAMSPGFNALAPWLAEILGGRQTARSLHFVFMLALVLFFVVHMAMIVLAGPLNELRSIVTGWYRADAGAKAVEEAGQ
jgi:thiosulfate reductase cytochrome b subunit